MKPFFALGRKINPDMNYNQYIPFLVRSLIVGVIAGVVGIILISLATSEIENSVSKISDQINFAPGHGKLSSAGERLVFNLKQMPPQRREELIAMTRAIAIELRPFAVELWPLLKSTCNETKKTN